MKVITLSSKFRLVVDVPCFALTVLSVLLDDMLLSLVRWLAKTKCRLN